jgi:hypothetical protein
VRIAGQRADQRDQPDHDRGDAETERALAVEFGQALATAEDAEQADRTAAQAEQAAGDAQRPLAAPPEHLCTSRCNRTSLAGLAQAVKPGNASRQSQPELAREGFARSRGAAKGLPAGVSSRVCRQDLGAALRPSGSTSIIRPGEEDR